MQPVELGFAKLVDIHSGADTPWTAPEGLKRTQLDHTDKT